jgi:very-short-patch-repair endonuclease
MRSLANGNPELARFDGRTHQSHVDEFIRLESEHKTAARIAATRVHYEKMPQGGAGPVGVLKAEIARKRGHMPIRQLMAHAAPAIQALKPVFMMSPLSVAQFLPPGEVHFDLLVIDEASQIQPVDALGAIARCRQAVVVGDEQQLPPTRFFSRMTGTQSEEDENDAAQVADLESILGLFLARGAAKRTLLWHYRSEHQSLIAVSNWKFYEDRLCVLPSPYTSESGRGLRFHYVSNGVYDSGKTRTNVAEARQVAAAVMQHARRHPDKTLGVGTFSIAQRRAILDQIELLRRADPTTESFFSTQAHEPFFVKNLENIQGDERDVIFISVGYGKNADGKMSMNFGPLSSQGGERRLNVLITRARQRLEVFSSITYADIDLDRIKGKGVATFELFLRYAQTGILGSSRTALPEACTVALEEDIAEALRSRGLEVDTQVGVSGAFVDVAVLDSDHRGRYILGIECDGRSYAEAKSARDRDRLRGEALRRQGWRLHRVWGMDWYQRPDEQLARIIAAIEDERQHVQIEADDAADRITEAMIEREEVRQGPGTTEENTCVYIEASPKGAAGGLELLEMPISALAEVVFEIVEVEGPIHQDEIVVRIRNAWGLHRAGNRIQEHVSKAIRAARISKGLVKDGKFLYIAGKTVKLRDRSKVLSISLRWPEMLPPGELREGIIDLVRANFGARQDEIVNTILRRLGYATTSVNLRDAVVKTIEKMLVSGSLAQHGELLLLVDSSAI